MRTRARKVSNLPKNEIFWKAMVYRGMGWKWKGKKGYLTHKLTKHLMLRLYIHTKWSKSDKDVSYDITYMCNLKK